MVSLSNRWAALGLILATQVNASPADLREAVRACAGLQDARDRLACFDQFAARLAVEQPATPAAAAGILTPQQRFGLSSDRIGELELGPAQLTKGSSELHARVSSVSARSDGLSVFTLDNAQVWAQTEKQPNFAVKPGDAVVVSRGALGSFWMSLSARLATRVRRLR